jgi:NMD protein affecting ribosome stability and mRNA decay
MIQKKTSKSPNYFEGILQLRNPTDEIIDFVYSEVEKKPDVWIAKVKKQKNGMDIQISSNKFLAEIGKKLKDTFPGEMVRSNTLFTENRQTSKQLYRGCYLFRYHDIKKDDVIEIRGKQIRIIAIGKEILGKEVDTNRKIHIKFDQLRRN